MPSIKRSLCPIIIGLVCSASLRGEPGVAFIAKSSAKVYIADFRQLGDATAGLAAFSRRLVELRLREIPNLEIAQPSESPPCRIFQGGLPESSLGEPQRTDNDSAVGASSVPSFYVVQGTIDGSGTKLGSEASTLLTYEVDEVVNCRSIVVVRNTSSFRSSDELRGLIAAADEMKSRLSLVVSDKGSVDVLPFPTVPATDKSYKSGDLLTRLLRQKVADSDALRLWDGSTAGNANELPLYRLTGDIHISAAGADKIAVDIRFSVNDRPLEVHFPPKVVEDSVDGVVPVYVDAATAAVNAIAELRYSQRADLGEVGHQKSGEQLSRVRQLLCLSDTVSDHSCSADPEAALLVLKRLPPAEASTDEALLLKAKAYVLTGQYSEAAGIYDAAFSRSTDASSRQSLVLLNDAADAWYEAEEYGQATERYLKYLRLSSSTVSTSATQGLQAQVRLRAIRSLTLAKRHLEAFDLVLSTLALIHSSPTSDDSTKQLYTACRSNLATAIDGLDDDDLEKASDHVAEDLSYDPGLEATALSQIGRRFYAAGRYDKATLLLSRSLEVQDKASPQAESRDVLDTLVFLISAFVQQWQYQQAEPFATRALGLATTTYAADDPKLAEVYANVAYVQRGLHNNQAAIPLLQKAISITSARNGENDQQVATYLDGLGYAYLSEGDLPDLTLAESTFNRAMTIRRKASGESSFEFALSLESLADVYKRQGKNQKADENLRKALSIRERVFGTDSSGTVGDLNTLGAVLIDEGKLQEAESVLQRARNIGDRAGATPRTRSTNLANLGLVYLYRGQYGRAEDIDLLALGLATAPESRHEYNMATISGTLGLIYTFRMKYAEADSMLESAKQLHEAAARAPMIKAITVKNLAELRRKQGRYDESEELYKHALGVWETSVGKKTNEYAVGLNGLGLLYLSENRLDEAEIRCKEALAIREKILGAEHWRNASSILALADIARRKGDLKSAENGYDRTTKIWGLAETPEHPDVATGLNGLAEIRKEQKRFKEAIELCNKGLALRKSIFGPEHRDVADSMVTLASIYSAQGHYDQAVPLYESAYSIYRQGVGANSPETVVIGRGYAEILRKANRVSDAERVELGLQQNTSKKPE